MILKPENIDVQDNPEFIHTKTEFRGNDTYYDINVDYNFFKEVPNFYVKLSKW